MKDAIVERLLRGIVVIAVAVTWWVAQVAYYENGANEPAPGLVEFKFRGREPAFVPPWVPGAFYGSWIVIGGAIAGLAVRRRRRHSRADEDTHDVTGSTHAAKDDTPRATGDSSAYPVADETLLALATQPKTTWVVAAYVLTAALAAFIVLGLEGASRVVPTILLAAAWGYGILATYLVPIAVAIEREALIIVRQRWVPPGTTRTRLPLADIKRVVRARDFSDEGTLLVETKTSGRHPMHFALSTRSYHTHLEVLANRTTTPFPASPMDLDKAVSAFCTVLEGVGVPVEFTPPRWYRRLWRKLNPPSP